MQQPTPVEQSGAAAPRFGLKLPIAVFRNPLGAYAMVASSREWLAAYALIVLLGFAELYLTAPTMAHLTQVELRSVGASSPAQVHDAIVRSFGLEAVWTVVGPFVLWGFVATLLAAAAIATRPSLSAFPIYFSLCVNCALPMELGQLLTAAATRLRDPASFRSANDVWTVLPISLAAVRGHGSVPEIAFLSYWSAFTLWSLILLGCGYAKLSKMSLVPALLLALGVGLALALAQVAGAT